VFRRAVYNYTVNGTASTKIEVLRLRLEDRHARFLRDLAREVNFVWSYRNDLQMFNRERAAS